MGKESVKKKVGITSKQSKSLCGGRDNGHSDVTHSVQTRGKNIMTGSDGIGL